MNWDAAVEYCSQFGASSKKRWRLPSPGEVEAAIKNGISSSKNPSFGWVYLKQVGTSTWEVADEKKVAVYMEADDSTPFRTSVDHDLSVLCVNTTSPNGSSDLWVDEKTNLVWRNLGEQLEHNSLESKCLEMSRAEKLPWRVPTGAELETEVKNGIQTSANLGFGHNYITIVWASDRTAGFGQDGLGIDLRNGNHYIIVNDQPLAGLCVRPRHY